MSSYTPQTWHDSPATDTPISAARLTVIENGIAASVVRSGDSMTGPLAVADGGQTNTHVIDAISAVDTTSAGFFKHLPASGAASANHSLTTYQASTSGTGSALNVVSDNPSTSCVQVSGVESGLGTIKVSHTKPAVADGNAAALSIDLKGSSTAAQGIFITSTTGGTTGNLINCRHNTRDDFVVKSTGRVGVGMAISATPGGALAVKQNDDTTKGLWLEANSSSSAVLIEARNSSGTPVMTVSPAGDMSAVNIAATGNTQGSVTPANHNLAAWAYDPSLCTNSSIVTNGTVYLIKMHIAAAVAVTKVYWHVAVVGATATAGQNHVGLYDSTGSKLTSTGVDADITSTGLKTTTISSQSLTAGSFYWVAMVFNATTAPTLARMSGLAGVGSLINVGLPAASYRFATNGTGQTTLPASVTPASAAQAPFPLWAAVGA